MKSSIEAKAAVLIIVVAGCLTLLPSQSAQAQHISLPGARNALYVELFGNGLAYSMNYERMFTSHVAARAGIMYVAGEDETTGAAAAVVMAPIMASYLLGEGNSHFEIGVGAVIANAETAIFGEEVAVSGVLGTGTLGYRYQRPEGGFIFRIGLTPVFGQGGFLPWGGLSFGYGF